MTMKRKATRIVAAGAAAATLAVTMISSPAMADIGSLTVSRPGGGDGTVPFRLTYGNSVVDGTVDFSNRSVDISGAVKSVSATHSADIFAYNADASCFIEQYPSAPVGTSKAFGFGGTCGQRGGFSSVTIWFPWT